MGTLREAEWNVAEASRTGSALMRVVVSTCRPAGAGTANSGASDCTTGELCGSVVTWQHGMLLAGRTFGAVLLGQHGMCASRGVARGTPSSSTITEMEMNFD